MNKEKEDKLTILGKTIKGFPESPDTARLETFTNSYPSNDYWVTLECPEYTSLCPKTGQPDFGNITIKYRPHEKCIETKSLKLFIFSFRKVGIFVEDAVNKILNRVVDAVEPKELVVKGEFNVRGGISIVVEAEYKK